MIGGMNVGAFGVDGTRFDILDIVKDGLVLHLDANKRGRCEPSVWYDSSSYSKNCVLTDVAFRDSYNGLLFNGITSVGTVPQISVTDLTCSVWVLPINVASPVIQNPVSGSSLFEYMAIRSLKLNWYTGSNWREINVALKNNVYYYMTWRSQVIAGVANNSLFLNGIKGFSGTDSLIGGNFTKVGSHPSPAEMRFLNGVMGKVELYNRALTDEEVLYNYNVNRGLYAKY